MLTFAFSGAADGIDRTFLEYQSAALRSVRQRIGSLERATEESTLGAILLLAGIEVRITFYLFVYYLIDPGSGGEWLTFYGTGSAWDAAASPASHGGYSTTS